MRPSLTTKYVSRQEVYDLINSSPHPEKRAEIRAETDRKFPREIWQENVPYFTVIEYLFNNHKEDFK